MLDNIKLYIQENTTLVLIFGYDVDIHNKHTMFDMPVKTWNSKFNVYSHYMCITII